MGLLPWLPLTGAAVAMLLVGWWVWADGRQPVKVQSRHPGSVVCRLFQNTQGPMYPRLQRRLGLKQTPWWRVLFGPWFNVVLLVGSKGLQLRIGASELFASFAPADLINITLYSPNGLVAVLVFEVRKHDGEHALFGSLVVHSLFRGLHRNEGMDLVLAMRKAAGLPELPTDDLWSQDPEIIYRDA